MLYGCGCLSSGHLILLQCTVHISPLAHFCSPFSHSILHFHFLPQQTPLLHLPPHTLLSVSAYRISSTNTELLTSLESQQIKHVKGSFIWKIRTWILYCTHWPLYWYWVEPSSLWLYHNAGNNNYKMPQLQMQRDAYGQQQYSDRMRPLISMRPIVSRGQKYAKTILYSSICHYHHQLINTRKFWSRIHTVVPNSETEI